MFKLFSDTIVAFSIVVLSTAGGIFALYILPTAGIALLIVASIGGLRLLLSYVRSPVGQHQDAGVGALTVAMVAAHLENDKLQATSAELAEATPAQEQLFTVGVINGYSAPGAGNRPPGGIPGPAEWVLPSASEQTREIPAAGQMPPRASTPRVLAGIG